MNSKLTLPAIAAAAALFFSSEAGAQAKSDIKSDPNSSSCTENCVDAGYEWAVANTPAQDGDCAAANEDFAAGCAHWLEEQREASAPPPEEPAEPAVDAAADAGAAADAAADAADAAADAADANAKDAADAADAAADAADSANSTQTDDSAAPPSDAPADPPSSN
jgi:hypothetical protein